MLEGHGFKNVYSMHGGVNAWDGITAKGPPEAGMAYFTPASGIEELIELAWRLEDGTRRFYLELHPSFKQEVANLYLELAKAEEHHQDLLTGLLREMSGKSSIKDLSGPGIEKGEAIMEGGIPVSEALGWAKEKMASEVAELALSLEANSFDLYIKMERRAEDGRAARIFLALAREEKQHLERLESLFEALIR